VLAHLAVNLLHGRAHGALGVGLSAWQNIYVIVVILIAPLVAMVLLWTRYARPGLWLLVVSMAGSLVFGAVYHYVFISPDHVSHLPPGDAQGMFRMTALLLILTELFGVVVGLLGMRTSLRPKAF
jgi:glucan phosphoethanolaminetransferase (alkaline phosphatase superfamily)